MRIDFDFHGDKQFSRDLLRIGGAATNLAPAFYAITKQLEGIESEQFASEGGRGGAAWAALSPATVAAKGHDTILVDTGDMRASLTGRTQHSIRKVGMQRLIFGSSVGYVGFHQHGTARMPQRRALNLREGDRKAIVKVIQAWVLGGGV